MRKILIVEDEEIIRSALRRLLEHHDYQVAEAGSVDEALTAMSDDHFNLIISDLRLPGAPGTDLIRRAGEIPVLIMTSYASVQSAVETMDMGAAFYIAKPFDHDDMVERVARLVRENSDQAQTSDAESPPPSDYGMLGRCAKMNSLFRQIAKVAPVDCTVLIQGETGTGKELVARGLHNSSNRARKPLICVNCAAIPETLIESELFGYEKGAFTGANTNRSGLIEAADGGTLFLDEIGELPLEAQARLLRFIQESEIRRIGSTESRTVDVRLLCATHRNLKNMAREGLFREDLYYRINVIRLQLPPLRERGSDILEIAEIMLERRSRELGKKALQYTPEAIQAITSYAWPGNIREMENAIERAVILCDGTEIDNELLGIDLKLVDVSQLRTSRRIGSQARGPRDHFRRQEDRSHRSTPDRDEDLSLEDYFQRFVLEHQDSMSETELARKLGVSRKCLWERRQRLGIPRKKNGRNADSA